MSMELKNPAAVWRLINTGRLAGSANMAIDEALMQHFYPGKSLPFFRLYGWQKPTLSLGHYQDQAEINRAACEAASLSVVRRFTGGGAIYHADELTYSLVCRPADLPEQVSIKEAYRVLTKFLIIAFNELDLDHYYASWDFRFARQRTPFCYASRESYDIVVRDRKLGGNAQRRTRDMIFQHGSIPLENHTFDGSRYMAEPPDGIEGKTTALRELGVRLSIADLESLLCRSFAQVFSVELVPSALTPEEEATARYLEQTKYNCASWNYDGVSASEE